MSSTEPLYRHVVASAARQLTATSFTHPGSAPTRAVTLIDSVYTRAQMRAERRYSRKTDTAVACHNTGTPVRWRIEIRSCSPIFSRQQGHED